MKSRSVSIDTDKISMIISRMNDSVQSIEDGADRSESGFAFLQVSENLSAGVNKIFKNLRTVSQRLSSYKNVVNKQGESFFEQEKYFSALADQLEVPTELSTVDNIFEVQTKSVNLNKNDGQAVNSNNDSSSVEYDESKNVENEALSSIVKDETEETEFKEQFDKEEAVLSNINKNDETSEVEMSDSFTENSVNLQEMNTEETEQTTVSPEYTERAVNLRDIHKNETGQVEFKQHYIDNEILLKSILEKTNQEGDHSDS